MTVSLSIHRDYACARSGACCTSGWTIAVEAPVYARVADAVRHGRVVPPSAAASSHQDVPAAGGLVTLLLPPAGSLPGDAVGRGPNACGSACNPPSTPAVLATDACGRCVFLHGDAPGTHACAIQSALGHDALPLACRQFPRVVLADARGTFVSLSHYCPTAAALLFRESVPLAIDTAPPAFPPAGEYVGLDARDTLPPLLRPDALHSLASYASWERLVVDLCAREDLSPEDVIALLSDAAERLRAWRAPRGSLDELACDVARDVAQAAPPRRPSALADAGESPCWHALARRTVPAPLGAPADGADFAAAWAALVAPRWTSFGAPVRRFLAARGFAAWMAYQGRGTRSSVRALAVALGVVKVEAARACGTAGRPLDVALLTDAFRQSDLLLVHLADPLALGRRLGADEGLPLA